jgi:hypothetical protein
MLDCIEIGILESPEQAKAGDRDKAEKEDENKVHDECDKTPAKTGINTDIRAVVLFFLDWGRGTDGDVLDIGTAPLAEFSGSISLFSTFRTEHSKTPDM